ncbi:MAG: sigma-54 dependent transcriptional regulator [Planctomycetota bacterium]|nr:sigma-54 dependent transcriptional regulator [Planctomycetota bacterium]
MQREKESKDFSSGRSLRVLFADDEPSIQELMRLELPRFGHEVTICPDGATALAVLEQSEFDCVVVDLDMPGVGGLDVIRRVREIAPDTESVIITGKSSLETAVAGLRQGVFDYLTKPCKLVEIEAVLQRVRKKRAMTLRVRSLERRVRQAEGRMQLVGNSSVIDEMQSLIAKVAASQATVLVRGETGTGKELVARSIHELSHRVDEPLVTVNCGGLPEQLVESELFGHRRGAFTGASEHRAGLFEVANGGTLFLDEVGELPPALQSRLLRVLESGEIRRVGDNHPITVDVRVVCATHRSLEKMVSEGTFREDLLFRLNTFEIRVPSLREHMSDLKLLIRHFIEKKQQSIPDGIQLITDHAIEIMQAYSWPGNVRELANCVEHALVLCDELPIRPEHIPLRIQRAIKKEMHSDSQSNCSGNSTLDAEVHGNVMASNQPQSLKQIERNAIRCGLNRNNGNKSRTADELGISLKTLYNKLNQIENAERNPEAA